MKTTIISGLLLLAAAVPAFADGTPPAADKNICLERHQINGWGSRDSHSMIVDDLFGKKYLVSLAGLCDDVNYALAAGFRPLGGGGDPCLERGDHVVLRGGGVLPHSVCWVTKIQYYTPAMEKADKEARANKQPLAAY